MSERVAVLTDSTAYLPDGVAEKYGITVVPLHVMLGERSVLEGVDLTPAEFAVWITAPGRAATTSQPSPAAFAAALDGLETDQVVAVHMSSKLSGTANAARLAGEASARTVRVVDSQSTAMGLGFAVIAAAEAAAMDADIEEVARAATDAAARTRTLFYVDTLEYLRRGGCIGAAAALFGTALSVKPLLEVLDGAIVPIEKVRTASRAIQRLEDVAVEHAGEQPVDIAVHHLASAERATALAERLRSRVAGLQSLYASEVGAVVGAHAGPGVLGIVVHLR